MGGDYMKFYHYMNHGVYNAVAKLRSNRSDMNTNKELEFEMNCINELSGLYFKIFQCCRVCNRWNIHFGIISNHME